MKKLLLLIIIPLFNFGQNSQTYLQDFVLDLDTFNRYIPTANFGGQTWRGPSWVDNVFNDSVATMCPDVLAYPPSPDVWDWENGWFYAEALLDTCCIDTIELGWGQLNADIIEITPQNFQNALDQIGSEGLYCLNMISSSMSKQLADLESAKNNGVKLERIRLGDEMGKSGNELSVSHFPTAIDYATTCDIYIDSIRSLLPNTKIAVSAGNFGAWNPRAQYWNEALYNMTNKADAFRWSAFFYLKDADTLFNTEQLLAYPFDQIPTYETVRGFKDSVQELQDYELWVGYNITDNTLDKRYLNRWSLVLMLSASHQIFLNNKLVTDISLFNVGGIFENWDALDTENNFRKRATGVFASIWNRAKLNKNRATKIKTPIELIDTITYVNNNNNNPREVTYPKLFGWRFENDSTYEASVILTNISSDTIFISIDNFISSSNVLWEKWSSDSLFDVIDSTNYINLITDTGTTNILLHPYSINVMTEDCINDEDIDDICDELEVEGCADLGACNYNLTGTQPCVFPIDLYGNINLDCNGNCLNDIDGDGVCDEYDNCLEDYNPNQEDFNSDNIGDACDGIGLIESALKRKLIKIIDVLGREYLKEKKGNLLLYIYDNGQVEKRHIIK
tara:strand:- start:346 stop:2208 length:1863 start_codon:yes stop_codon:yes gene_type:complete